MYAHNGLGFLGFYDPCHISSGKVRIYLSRGDFQQTFEFMGSFAQELCQLVKKSR